MGGTLSAVQNNDELVEYLLDNRYLRRKEVEIVFRSVDRANYVLPSHEESAYNDTAWKHGNLHLSAPCVYAVAMEYLSLKPGQSFLNIGSGTGYLSTMAGLLLGPYGINHGIELHEDCIQYARDRLENFKQKSEAFEEFEFCEPSFAQGNCLRIIQSREYDTVYCGAAVSENNLPAVKRFVKIGGSIVMPYKGRLCCFKRLTETGWSCKKSLGVSFATLITPDVTDQNSFSLPESEPLSLQEMCRTKIREILRKNVWTENPELGKRNLNLLNRQPRSDSFFDQSDDGISDDEDHDDEDEEGGEEDEDEDEEEELDDADDPETDGHVIRRTRFLFNMEVDSNETTSNPLQLRRVAMLVRQRIGAQQQRAEALLDRITEEMRHEDPTLAAMESPNSPEQNGNSSFSMENSESMEASGIRVPDELLDETEFMGYDLLGSSSQAADSNRDRKEKTTTRSRERNERESDSDWGSASDTNDDYITQWNKIAKRENTDSGIVEDVNATFHDTSSSSNVENSESEETEDDMDVDLSSVALRETIRRFTSSQSTDDDDNNTQNTDTAERRLFINYMKDKILLLPLPTKMKIYINHNRSL